MRNRLWRYLNQGSTSWSASFQHPKAIKLASPTIHVEGSTFRDMQITEHRYVYQNIHSDSVDAVTVEAAQTQLAELPLDTIPEIATLPKGSRMFFAPYKHFVGRKKELHRLASLLKGQQGTAAIGQMAAATGLGGIGKTQLAIEFAHRYGHYFAGGVFWLDFSAAAGISNEVARCGGAEGMNLLLQQLALAGSSFAGTTGLAGAITPFIDLRQL